MERRVKHKLSWSPDGKSIAYLRASSAHTGDGLESVVHILDVASGQSRALSGRSSREASPRFSPDGKSIAYDYPAAAATTRWRP